MILRPYQHEAARCVMEEWRSVISTLVVMPTGLGKTVLFADIIRRIYPRRAMVVAHREELIRQACEKIHAVTGLRTTVEMADQYADLGADMLSDAPRIVVSTVQTLTNGGDGCGRLNKFDPQKFGVLIIDEFHHSTAKSYRRVIDWFKQNPNLRILGVTATPDRADEEALGQVCDTVAFDYEIENAINDGWLVPIHQQMVNVSELDFSQMRTTAGDLNGADLSELMEREDILHRIASPSIDIIGKRRALVFTASVVHAERLCEIFNRHKDGMAAWVCGKTDKEDRRRILAEFAAGKIQVVCNCGVLTEGFDDPGVEVIIMGRPTKSRSLYAQMCGRSTRPLPGIVDGPETAEARKDAIAHSAKPNCLIVDFTGNSGRHKLVSAADILGGNYSDEIVQAAIARTKKSAVPVDISEALEEEKRLHLERQQAEAARRARLTFKASYTVRSINPFETFGIEPPVHRGWDIGKELSEKQRGLLLKQGIDPSTLTYSEGKRLIAELFRRWDSNLCSFKQAKVLSKHGYETTNLTREEASKLMDGLKANGWKRPQEHYATMDQSN